MLIHVYVTSQIMSIILSHDITYSEYNTLLGDNMIKINNNVSIILETE